MPKVELINKEFKEEVEGIHISISQKALEYIKNTMPSKIIELTNLLKSPDWVLTGEQIQNNVNFPEILFDIEHVAKKRKLETDKEDYTSVEIPSNELVSRVIEGMKAHMLDLLEIVSTIKMYIQLNIPRIEDGNNFGVAVQEDTLNELGRIEESAYNSLEFSTKYYLNRAKYLTKVIRYPGIVDYKQAIREIDEKEYVNSVISIKDLRNNYSILHDLITKNWPKISNPKSQNSSATVF